MNHYLFRIGVVLIIGAVQSLVFGLDAPTTEPSREASALLQQIDALKPPVLDESKRDDTTYIESYIRGSDQYEQKRSELAKKFLDRFSDDPRAASFRKERWLDLARRGYRQEIIDETAPFLAKTTDPKTRADILFLRAKAAVIYGRTYLSTPAVEEFVQAAPQDERGGELFFLLAQTEHNPARKAEFYRRVADHYAETLYGKPAKGVLRQLDGLGKPFELIFTDAISGKQISVQKDLKGKIVVIDFWATWCAPCVSAMPENNRLCAQYKNDGVEFIGVSLDEPETQGGLKKLKDFVQTNGITWPQYYQGNGAESEFSSGWGVVGIPTVFIVDRDGKLYSVEASGQLASVIQQMLTKRG